MLLSWSWYAQGEVLVGSGIRRERYLDRAITDVCGSEVRCCPCHGRSCLGLTPHVLFS